MTARELVVAFLTASVCCAAVMDGSKKGEGENTPLQAVDGPHVEGNIKNPFGQINTNFRGNTVAKKKPVIKNIVKEHKGRVESTDSPGKSPHIPQGCLVPPVYINQGAVEKRKSHRPGYPVVIEYECDMEGTEKYKFLAGPTEALCDSDGRWILPAMICIPTTCYLRTSRVESWYAGDENKTKTNITCQQWAKNRPNRLRSKYHRNSVFPSDLSMDEASNKCRDMFRDGRPWCYAMDSVTRWEFCDIPECKKIVHCGFPPHMTGTRPIKAELEGQEVRVTYSCHDNLTYFGKEKTATCNLITGKWSLPDMLCAALDCFYLRRDGHAVYMGTESVTKSGRSCQRFDARVPHDHSMKTKPEFLTSAASMGDECRDVKHPAMSEPWCYTLDPRKRWETCAIRECNLHGYP